MVFFFAPYSLWAVGHFLFGFFSFVTGSVWSLIYTWGFFMSDAFLRFCLWEGHFFFLFSSFALCVAIYPPHDQEG